MNKRFPKKLIMIGLGLVSILLSSIDVKASLKCNWEEESSAMRQYNSRYDAYIQTYETSVYGDRALEQQHPFHKYTKNWEEKYPIHENSSLYSPTLSEMLRGKKLSREQYLANIRKWDLLRQNTKKTSQEIEEIIDHPEYIDSSKGEFPGIDWQKELVMWEKYIKGRDEYYKSDSYHRYHNPYHYAYGSIPNPYNAYIKNLRIFQDPSKPFHPPSEGEYEAKLRDMHTKITRSLSSPNPLVTYDAIPIKKVELKKNKIYCENWGLYLAGTVGLIATTIVYLNQELLDQLMESIK